mgnify:CR=1 FL=1
MELFFYLHFQVMKPGDFLIATPSIIGDFNFQRSCVLIVDIKESGSVGFIVNKKLEHTLSDVMENISIPLPLFYGGPVEQDNLFFTHTLGDLIPNSIKINNNLFWSGNLETVLELLKSGKLDNNKIRFFLGYSGWSKGQLESEFEDNSWVISNIVNSNDWMEQNTEEFWKNEMRALGGKYLLWSNAPDNPMSN